MRHYSILLFLSLLLSHTVWGDDKTLENLLVEQCIQKYLALERFNDANEQRGRKDLNQYIIQLSDPNSVEDRASLVSEELMKAVTEFNERKDLRFYLITLTFTLIPKPGVDLTKIVEKDGHVNSLRNYFQYDPGEKVKYEETVKNILDKSESVLNSVSGKLIGLGYEERMIYLYRQITAIDSNLQPICIASDKFEVAGKKLKSKEADIQSISKKNWVLNATETSGRRLEKAAYNIMSAIHLVIDEGYSKNSDGPGCQLTLAQAVAESRDSRVVFYEANALAAAKLLEDPRDSPRRLLPEEGNPDGISFPDNASILNDPRDVGGVVIDDENNFPLNNTYLKCIMPDVVNMMAKHSNVIMDVIFKEIQFAMPPSDWVGFAETVYNKSLAAKDHLVLVVPYYRSKCTFEFKWGDDVKKTDRNLLLEFPAVYFPSNRRLQDEINGAFMAAYSLPNLSQRPFEVGFKNALKKIPKKARIYSYSINWKGDLITHPPTETDYIVGNENFVKVAIQFDKKRFEMYQSVKTIHIGNLSRPLSPEEITEAPGFARLIEMPADFIFLPVPDLRQSKLNEATALTIAKWIANRETHGVFSDGKSPDDALFVCGENTSEIAERQMLLTLLSLIPGPVGITFTAITAVYCLSHGKYGEAILTAAMIGAPHTLSTLLPGKSLLSKTGTGKFVIYPAEWFKISDFKEFPQLINDVFSHDFLVRLAKYEKLVPGLAKKIEEKLVMALERSEAEAKAILDALDNDPSILDRWYNTNPKGDILDFLRMEGKIPNANINTLAPISNEVKWRANGDVEVYAEGNPNSVGSGFLNDEGYIEMTIDVKIGVSDAPVAKGGDVFDKIYNELANKHGANNIKGIKSNWLDDAKLRDQLDSFNKAILDYIGQGMDPKAAALKAARENTFTGAMAGKRGFTEIKPIDGLPRTNGTFPEVTVHFTRPVSNVNATQELRGTLMAIGEDDIVLKSADILKRLAPPKNGELFVVVHASGNPGTPFKVFENGKWVEINSESLAARLKLDGLNEVQIFSCGCEQVKELAERMGKESGLTIKVPNVPITLTEVEGTAVAVGKQEGHWARFNGKTGEWEVPFENNVSVAENLRIRKATDAEAANLAFLGIKGGDGKAIVFEPSINTAWVDLYKKSLQKLAAAVKRKQGYFDVFIEVRNGRFILMSDFSTEILTPEGVATILYEKGYNQGTSIRLIIRNADNTALTPNGPIQQLADALGAKTETHIFTPDEIMQTDRAIGRIDGNASTAVLFPSSEKIRHLGLVGARKEGDVMVVFTMNNNTYQNLLISGQVRSDGVTLIKNINENLLKEEKLLESIRSAFSSFDKYSGTKEIKAYVVTWSRKGTPRQWKEYQTQLKKLTPGQPTEIAAGQTSVGQALQEMSSLESPDKITESLLKFMHIKSIPTIDPNEVAFLFSKEPSFGPFR